MFPSHDPNFAEDSVADTGPGSPLEQAVQAILEQMQQLGELVGQHDRALTALADDIDEEERFEKAKAEAKRDVVAEEAA